MCEQLGSLAHGHWQDQRDEAPTIAMPRVHLLQGGICCLGSARDDAVARYSTLAAGLQSEPSEA